MEKSPIAQVCDELLSQHAMIKTLYMALADAGVISREALALYLRNTLEAGHMTDEARECLRGFIGFVEGDLKPRFTVIPGDKER